MWSHDYELESDGWTLEEGFNLLYLSSGDTSFNYDVARGVADGLNVKVNRLFCFDVRNESEQVIKDAILGAANGEESVMTVLQGVEALPGSQRRKLNFAFRLTDATTEYSNSVVFFAHERQTDAGAGTDADAGADASGAPDASGGESGTRANALRLKDVLAEQLDNTEVSFNGRAFLGRMARTAFQDTPAPAPEVDICALLEASGRALARSHVSAPPTPTPQETATLSNTSHIAQPDLVFAVGRAMVLFTLFFYLLRFFNPSARKVEAPTVPAAAAVPAAATAPAATVSAAAGRASSKGEIVTSKVRHATPKKASTEVAGGKAGTGRKTKSLGGQTSSRRGTSPTPSRANPPTSTQSAPATGAPGASGGEGLRRSARQAGRVNRSRASSDS
jgi:hypothetical protein